LPFFQGGCTCNPCKTYSTTWSSEVQILLLLTFFDLEALLDDDFSD
jgi:hypothetical protein